VTPGPGATTGATGADDGGNGASLPGLDEQLDRVEGEPTAVYTALATFESALRDALDAVGRHVVRTRLSADVDAIPSRAPSFPGTGRSPTWSCEGCGTNRIAPRPSSRVSAGNSTDSWRGISTWTASPSTFRTACASPRLAGRRTIASADVRNGVHPRSRTHRSTRLQLAGSGVLATTEDGAITSGVNRPANRGVVDRIRFTTVVGRSSC
jgi:hypothetical protein